MKIRIEMTTKEKYSFLEALECPPSEDNSVKSEGKFGSFEYDKEKCLFTFDLKEDFITAFSSLVGSLMFTVKGILRTFKTFERSWFEDIKTEIKKEEENKEEEKTNEEE